jgi:hypothetical protein
MRRTQNTAPLVRRALTTFTLAGAMMIGACGTTAEDQTSTSTTISTITNPSPKATPNTIGGGGIGDNEMTPAPSSAPEGCEVAVLDLNIIQDGANVTIQVDPRNKSIGVVEINNGKGKGNVEVFNEGISLLSRGASELLSAGIDVTLESRDGNDERNDIAFNFRLANSLNDSYMVATLGWECE